MTKKIIVSIYCLLFIFSPYLLFSQTDSKLTITSWVTTADRTKLFERQQETITLSTANKGWGTPIVIDDKQTYQTMDGFGFSLTGGSAGLLIKMNAAERAALLKQLFAVDGENAGISYIRLSIGASDMNSYVFSYNDMPEGQKDFELKKFSLAQDLKDVIPVMKEILAINPTIKIMSSPWSAPTWMKTNNKVKKGFLKKECYPVYADYFVRYIQAMKQEGIIIDAITIQNEPLNANNTPSMQWLAADAADFIKNNLGPAFKNSLVTTKIILFDHNCDRPDYPLLILKDTGAAKYIDGSGFHFYGGEMSALTTVHMAMPDKNLYFTEQMVVESPGEIPMKIADAVKNLIVDAPRNWSKNVLLWNLAADSLNGPHTDDGGCPMCQGAITISGNIITRNIAYYAVLHSSKFVRPGSVRIASTGMGEAAVVLTNDEEQPTVMRVAVLPNFDILPNVAYKTPEGKIVLIVANNESQQKNVRIQYKGMYATLNLAAGSVGTYVW